MSTSTNTWHYLEHNPREPFRQLSVKGTAFLAWDLYCDFMNEEEPMTPEEIAEAWGVPIEAVWEAIAYCESKPPEIQGDFDAQDAFFREHGLDKPHPLSPSAQKNSSTPS